MVDGIIKNAVDTYGEQARLADIRNIAVEEVRMARNTQEEAERAVTPENMYDELLAVRHDDARSQIEHHMNIETREDLEGVNVRDTEAEREISEPPDWVVGQEDILLPREQWTKPKGRIAYLKSEVGGHD